MAFLPATSMIGWAYQRERPVRVPVRHPQNTAEFVADGIIHGVGLVAGVAGALLLLAVVVSDGGTWQVAAAAVYAFGMLAMLSCSAAYNMLHRHPRRGVLRWLDHIAIYLMIAGTYTPFLATLKGPWAAALTGAMWGFTAICILLKLLVPNLKEAVSILLYLILGWIGVVAFWPLAETLDHSTLVLLATGGVIYSIGVVFHVLDRLPFNTAIWHAFVLGAAVVHYIAVIGVVRDGT